MASPVLVFPLTRLLIGLALFLAVRLLGDLAYVAALGRSPGAIVDRAIVTAAALVVLVFVGVLIERRRPAELGLPWRNALHDLGLGLALGAGLLTAIVGLMALFGWYQVTDFLWNQPGGNTLTVAALGLLYYGLVSVSEEVLFRGMLFRIIEEGLGTWVALALSALVFGLAHLINDNATLWSAVAIAVESGILFGAVYVLTRALWLPIGLHWTWNYFEGYVYGTPVSGANQPGLLLPSITGPNLWMGGAFGPEAGLIAVILCGAAGVLVLVLCARRKTIFTPVWLRRRQARDRLAGGSQSQPGEPVQTGSPYETAHAPRGYPEPARQ